MLLRKFVIFCSLAAAPLLQATPVLNAANPLVNPALFRVTTFATGLNFPSSMARLADGSVLVGTSIGSGANPGYLNYYSAAGQLLRLTDTDGNGVADNAGTVVASNIVGAITSVRTFGDVVAVATVGDSSNPNSSQASIHFFRQGALPTDGYTSLGSIGFTYSQGTQPSASLAVRETPGQPGKFDLFFALPGSSHEGGNAGTITATGLINGSFTPGTGWRTTVTPTSGSFGLSAPTQFASGIRVSAGMVFDSNGALILSDNGFQSLTTGLEVSADELNRIAASSLSSSTFLGYPDNYPDYTTGAFIGGAGQQPLTAFIPQDGVESRGAAEVAQAPANFPAALRDGYFVGFHGLWDQVGRNNAINPVYYVDPITGQYSAFIAPGQAGFSKPDGLLGTPEGLYIADLFTARNFGPSSGEIYLISLDEESVPVSGVPEPSTMATMMAGLAAAAYFRPARRSKI